MGDDGETPEVVVGELVAESSPRSARPGQPGAGRPFRPGESGCPGGKPPGWGELRRKLVELDDDAIKTLKAGLTEGPLATRAAYLRLFFEYRLGKRFTLTPGGTDEDGNRTLGGVVIMPTEEDDDGE